MEKVYLQLGTNHFGMNQSRQVLGELLLANLLEAINTSACDLRRHINQLKRFRSLACLISHFPAYWPCISPLCRETDLRQRRWLLAVRTLRSRSLIEGSDFITVFQFMVTASPRPTGRMCKSRALLLLTAMRLVRLRLRLKRTQRNLILPTTIWLSV